MILNYKSGINLFYILYFRLTSYESPNLYEQLILSKTLSIQVFQIKSKTSQFFYTLKVELSPSSSQLACEPSSRTAWLVSHLGRPPVSLARFNFFKK